MPETIEHLLSGISADFVFKARPTSLPPELRPDWRISVLLLILKITGRAGKASLKKLHVLGWVIRHQSQRDAFLQVLAGDVPADSLMIRFDPALNRAVEFAVGSKLLAFERLSSGGLNIVLTASGKDAAARIVEHQDCLVSEKAFLHEVGKISEARVESILTWKD